MDKKSQTNYRQASLSVSKESGANKFVNGDWKRENYSGRFQGNEANKKHNHTKSNNVIDNRRPRSRNVVGKYQKEEVKKYPSHDAEFEEGDEMVDVADVFDKNGKQSRNLTNAINVYQQKERSLRYAGSKAGQKKITRGSKKERFMQANCQFVVKSSGDYDKFVLDPDVFIDWDLILEVRLFVHELPSCPICLYPPRAAKITKCGHVYCWPCMLHYISLSSEKGGWSKCPICCEPVYSDDLKSVSIIEVTKFEPGMQIKMKLMSKTRGDTVVSPSVFWRKENALQSIRDGTKSAYAKLLRADLKYLNEMLENEKSELRNMLKEEEPNSLESTFITFALELNWTTANKELSKVSQATGSFEECDNEANSKTEFVSESSEATCDMPQTPPSLSLVENKKKLKYFYQAEDGQHIYMHSLNVRCLTAEYSSMEFCPKEIVAVIVDIEEFCISDDTRQHFNYLSHLPIGCQFKIVELDLLPPLISPDSLRVSEEIIKRRKREREMRERRDKKNAAHIQKIHNKMMGYDPESRIISSDFHKLQDGEVLREELSGSHHFPEFKGFSGTGDDGVGALFEKNETDKEGSKLSFAQMLRSGKVKPLTLQPIPAGPAKKDDSDAGEVPEFSSSWNIDLSKKLEETLISVKQGNTKGGKKNKKGILLFATGAAGPRCK